eukprot:Colp12_sorted_trinity150504_noHs@33056
MDEPNPWLSLPGGSAGDTLEQNIEFRIETFEFGLSGESSTLAGSSGPISSIDSIADEDFPTLFGENEFSLLHNEVVSAGSLDALDEKTFWIEPEPQNLNEVERANAWTYSQVLSQLFVNKDVAAPLVLRYAKAPPPGAVVRVTLMYKDPKHRSSPVLRCPNHLQEEGTHEALHVLRSTNPRAEYMVDSSGVCSVVVPFNPEEDEDSGEYVSPESFKFTCFNSCPGGLNRRPFEAIFTLEAQGQVLGVHSVNVRICACPGRDRRTAEKAEAKKNAPLPKIKKQPAGDAGGAAKKGVSPSNTISEKRTVTSFISRQASDIGDPNKTYTVQVIGHENYKIVMKILEGLNALKRQQQQPGRGMQRTDTLRALPAPTPTKSEKTEQPSRKRRRQENKGAEQGEDGSATDTEVEDTEEGKAQQAVQQWLTSHGFGKYAEAFIDAGFDNLVLLSNLTEEDLDMVRVTKPGHRKGLLVEVAKLKEQLAKPSSSVRGLQMVRCTFKRTLSAANPHQQLLSLPSAPSSQQ